MFFFNFNLPLSSLQRYFASFLERQSGICERWECSGGGTMFRIRWSIWYLHIHKWAIAFCISWSRQYNYSIQIWIFEPQFNCSASWMLLCVFFPRSPMEKTREHYQWQFQEKMQRGHHRRSGHNYTSWWELWWRIYLDSWESIRPIILHYSSFWSVFKWIFLCLWPSSRLLRDHSNRLDTFMAPRTCWFFDLYWTDILGSFHFHGVKNEKECLGNW